MAIDCKISIAAIITCHNRREKTLRCLQKLYSQDEIKNVILEVFLVDDGSTDGTTVSIKDKYPQVNILQGDGTLFWNGGMRLAFAEAHKINFNYYLWLNDDTFLYKDAVQRLLETEKHLREKRENPVIITGTIQDIETGEINFGGRIQKSKWHPLHFLLLGSSPKPQRCDTFNGNIVLIPQPIVTTIGNISVEFSKQHGGDFDYGLRAKSAGFESWVAPGIVGECASNSIKGSLFDQDLPFGTRLKKMRSPQGAPPAKEWMIFAKRHAGFLWPYYWFRTMIRVAFPWAYLLFRNPHKDSKTNSISDK